MILFEGKPIPRSTRAFAPKRRQGPTAIGDVVEASRFNVNTHRPGDGIIPGTNRIRVEFWETPPTVGGPPPESAVPEKYTNMNTTDLTLDVPSEPKQIFEIVLQP